MNRFAWSRPQTRLCDEYKVATPIASTDSALMLIPFTRASGGRANLRDGQIAKGRARVLAHCEELVQRKVGAIRLHANSRPVPAKFNPPIGRLRPSIDGSCLEQTQNEPFVSSRAQTQLCDNYKD